MCGLRLRSTATSAVFKSLTQIARPAHKRWTDAYLAGFALGSGLAIVTFDADLTSFQGLSVRLLA